MIKSRHYTIRISYESIQWKHFKNIIIEKYKGKQKRKKWNSNSYSRETSLPPHPKLAL